MATCTSIPTACSVKPKYNEKVKIKALEWFGTKDVRVVERPQPLICDPQDAVIRTTTTTICGSDLHLYAGLVPSMEKHDVMGHEAVGIVEQVGEAVTNVHVGDRVVVSAVIACGSCWYCKDQQFSLCDSTNPSKAMQDMYGHRISGIFGYSHLTGGYDGCQSEFVRVPFANVNLLKLPHSIRDDQAIFLSDVACTGFHGTELGCVSKGQVVAIWGAGPVGLMAAKFSKLRGASRVFVIDDNASRLAVARDKLGCDIIDFSQEKDVPSKLLSLIDRGPDVCIECAGFRFPKTTSQKISQTIKFETDSSDILNEMIKSCRKGGTISIIGDYFAFCNNFNIGAMMEKSLTVRGGQVFVQKYWQHILGLMVKGEFDPTFELSHTLPFEDAAQAYDMFWKKADNAIKILLKTQYSMQQGTVQPGIGATVGSDVQPSDSATRAASDDLLGVEQGVSRIKLHPASWQRGLDQQQPSQDIHPASFDAVSSTTSTPSSTPSTSPLSLSSVGHSTHHHRGASFGDIGSSIHPMERRE